MKYKNPVIFADYSDPDVIRSGENYFMVASSFNYTPSVPVLHSLNLVEWELINYVSDRLPFEKYDKVRAGEGAWAPSIRFHNGKYYCLIPFPDEGVFVSETDDLFGKWSPMRPLIAGKGVIDPCPIWADGKCYIAVAFAKSRAGFNSCIGLYEADEELGGLLSPDYRIIYDGHDVNPTIEGPKFYRHGEYYYILAPAGSVKSGWQTALRSKNIYGPYESKIILMQNDSDINGPHQGALVDLPDGKWAFLHFQDLGAYGRVVHLQPAEWVDDWIICGEIRDRRLAGTPVTGGNYPVDRTTGFSVPESDDFSDGLSLMWQTPANKGEDWYRIDRGLRLNCVKGEGELHLLPQIFTAKITRRSFCAECRVVFNPKSDGDETGLCVTGRDYSCVCLAYSGGKTYLKVIEGGISRGERTVFTAEYNGRKSVTLAVSAENGDINRLFYKYSVDGEILPCEFRAEAGVWVGAKIGIYARNAERQSGGYATFKYFKTDKVRERKPEFSN